MIHFFKSPLEIVQFGAGVPEWNDEQIATNDHRTLLIPEGQLRRKLRILIDSGLDLQRSVDEARLRKTVSAQSPVFVAITSAGHPTDQIVSIRGRKRKYG